MPTFNVIHLHRYLLGLITQAQILALYPWETVTTLTRAVASRNALFVDEVI